MRCFTMNEPYSESGNRGGYYFPIRSYYFQNGRQVGQVVKPSWVDYYNRHYLIGPPDVLGVPDVLQQYPQHEPYLAYGAGSDTFTMFVDSNFGGSSKKVTGGVSNLKDLGWNDKISSFKIRTGRWWDGSPKGRYILYDDKDWSGKAYGPYFDGDYPSPSGAEPPFGNDRITAIKHEDIPKPVPPTGIDFEKIRESVLNHYRSHLGDEPNDCVKNLLDKYIKYFKEGNYGKFGLFGTTGNVAQAMANPNADRQAYALDIISSYVNELCLDVCGSKPVRGTVGTNMDEEATHEKIITGNLTIDTEKPLSEQPAYPYDSTDDRIASEKKKKYITWGIVIAGGALSLIAMILGVTTVVKRRKAAA
jgi:hypothetical protein